mmetsp:Transcript_137127/g.292904  ORF Transcript_137127/g.292904 Transcript_137127/m.292904 type:complete len:218 (-) Transcript_137127:162-815(-)
MPEAAPTRSRRCCLCSAGSLRKTRSAQANSADSPAGRAADEDQAHDRDDVFDTSGRGVSVVLDHNEDDLSEERKSRKSKSVEAVIQNWEEEQLTDNAAEPPSDLKPEKRKSEFRGEEATEPPPICPPEANADTVVPTEKAAGVPQTSAGGTRPDGVLCCLFFKRVITVDSIDALPVGGRNGKGSGSGPDNEEHLEDAGAVRQGRGHMFCLFFRKVFA